MSTIHQRRAAMREDLIRDMRTFHRRRRTRNAALACALLLALAAIPLWFRAQAPTATAPSITAIPPQQTPAIDEPPRAVRIVRVNTPPGIIERLRIDSPPALVQRINDDELTSLLADIGRPSGIIRQGDRVWLTAEVETSSLHDGS